MTTTTKVIVKNLEKRLEQHNSGMTESIRPFVQRHRGFYFLRKDVLKPETIKILS